MSNPQSFFETMKNAEINQRITINDVIYVKVSNEGNGKIFPIMKQHYFKYPDYYEELIKAYINSGGQLITKYAHKFAAKHGR